MNLIFVALVSALVGISFGATGDNPWEPLADDQTKHEALLKQTAQHGKDIKIVFVGDSITEGWTTAGMNVWNQYYANRGAYNYGVAGDRTQNIIYRIQNKEFDGLSPKATVLMIGTNNVPWPTSVDDIAHGIKEVITELQAKMPSTKVILVGVLPRSDQQQYAEWNTKAKQLNALIQKFANNSVYWLDMWNDFGDAQGNIKTNLYNGDKIHLGEAGYKLWHDNIEPILKKLDTQ